jgi:hypothetical protein
MNGAASRPYSVLSRACRALEASSQSRRARKLALAAALGAALAAAATDALGTGAVLAAGSPTRSVAATAGHIYWSNPESARGTSAPGINAIGRANRDGSGVQKSFIANPPIPDAVAVGAGHIYWIEGETGTIARANLDGSHVNHSFLFASGLASALAVGGGHIYWASGGAVGEPAKIGRANLDGSHVKRNLFTIGSGSYIGGLALNRRFIYWTNRDKGTIGRVDLSGRHARPRFISGAHDPTGLALDARHLYWANNVPGASTGTIARADLSGAHVNESLVTGANGPFGVAVDASYIYWANNGGGTIGRATLTGGAVNQAFITTLVRVTGAEGAPLGLAVGP